MTRPLRGLLLSTLFASLPAAAFAQDRDGDGTPDASDAFPCDPALQAVAFAPAAGQHGLLLFEDHWPWAGDLDFNDLVLGFHYEYRMTAAGQVRSLFATFNVRAIGGTYENGLGLHLPVPAGQVASVTRRVGSGAPQALTPRGDAELTVTLSQDLRELFGDRAGAINALPSEPRQQGQLLEVEVVFTAPVELAAGAGPHDVFIFRSTDPSHEIHRPEFGGTAAMRSALFGTVSDASGAGRWFVDQQGLPFALVLPNDAAYPAEGVAIAQLFPAIVTFAAAGGELARDFYASQVASAFAYRDAAGEGAPPAVFGARSAPRDLCFAPREGHGPGSVASSESITLDGFTGAIELTLSGPGAPELRIDGGPWVTSASNVTAPSTLELRLTAEVTPGAAHAVVLSVNGAPATTWSVVNASWSTYAENRNNAGTTNTFVVPASCPRVRIQAWGAGGGGRNNQYVGRGGGGGYVEALLPVSTGQRLTYIVGGGGRTGPQGSTGGSNGGGNGNDGAGGGGCSHVAYEDGTVLVSAGGGGGGTATTNSDYPGEWIWGRPGGAESVGGPGHFNGSGGTPTTFGRGGDVNGVCPGQNGSWGRGGNGGNSSRSGGGGGGHFGGGGGRCNKGGGGGGANYVHPNAALGIAGIVRTPGIHDVPGNAAATERAGAGNGGIADQNGANGRIIITCTGP